MQGEPRRVPCAGAIVHDRDGRLLLIRRGRPPAAGLWSVPGGRCEPGEDTRSACVRETAEETGLRVEVRRRAGSVERDAPNGDVYVIDDYVCLVTGGELRAGDDAEDACWAGRDDLDRLEMAPGVVDALTEWGLLPRR